MTRCANNGHRVTMKMCPESGLHMIIYGCATKATERAPPLCMTVLRCLSAHGCACLCPADSEGQNAMQQVGVVKPVMPSGCSELLALRYFGIGIRFDEIRSAIGSEAKVDGCVSIEPQCAVAVVRLYRRE